MQITDISKLIGETTEYDKKQNVEIHKPKSWLKSVSAFANTNGGSLIFGISDNDEIIGLQNPEGDAEKISELIKTRISAIPEFNLRFYNHEDKKLIILDIPKGIDTPYYYVGDGNSEAFIRVGNQSVKAAPSDLKRHVLRGRNSTYDSLLSGYNFIDFSFSKLRERYKVWTGRSFEDKNFESFGICDNSGRLTNAGALIADESPIRYSRVFCTRWNGKDKSSGIINAIDSAEYSGSLISLLNDSAHFIKRNQSKKWFKTAASRVDLYDYEERSYFEALVNALIHRDYLIVGSEVHVDMFDDRMEIYSPGGMPDGTFIQNRDIMTVPSVRRNPVLADIFSQLGYMERQASGFGKILNGYKTAFNFTPGNEPSFLSDTSQFVVIFPNLNYGKFASLSDSEDSEISDANGEVLYVSPAEKTQQVSEKTQQVNEKTQQVNEKTQQVSKPKIAMRMNALVEYCTEPKTLNEMISFLGLNDRNNFTRIYLNPLLKEGRLRMTDPDKPKSKRQKYVKV